MTLIETLYDELVNIGEKPNSIVGCTSDEIAEVKQIQNVTNLPEMYYEFMSKMGRGAGRLFEGTAIFYGGMKYFNFRDEAQNFLRDMDVEFNLPEKAFVFLLHQGYTFFYFDTLSDLIDPIIYRYQEGYNEPKNAGHLSDLFLEELKLLKKVIGYEKG